MAKLSGEKDLLAWAVEAELSDLVKLKLPYGSAHEKNAGGSKLEQSLSSYDRIGLFHKSASPTEDVLAIVLHNRKGYRDLCLRDMKENAARMVTRQSVVGYGEWASDGTTLAFLE